MQIRSNPYGDLETTTSALAAKGSKEIHTAAIRVIGKNGAREHGEKAAPEIPIHVIWVLELCRQKLGDDFGLRIALKV